MILLPAFRNPLISGKRIGLDDAIASKMKSAAAVYINALRYADAIGGTDRQ
jgi:hypothetical protein